MLLNHHHAVSIVLLLWLRMQSSAICSWSPSQEATGRRRWSIWRRRLTSRGREMNFQRSSRLDSDARIMEKPSAKHCLWREWSDSKLCNCIYVGSELWKGPSKSRLLRRVVSLRAEPQGCVLYNMYSTLTYVIIVQSPLNIFCADNKYLTLLHYRGLPRISPSRNWWSFRVILYVSEKNLAIYIIC